MPVNDDALHDVLIGGLEPGRITLAEYDLRWPDKFALERKRIAAAIGSAAILIEHIGSTSVPGLAAKPVIDILVTVRNVEIVDDYRDAMETAGYTLRVREAGHCMFRTGSRDVHVHFWCSGCEEETRHLTFRDRLRENADDRKLYERTKRELAKVFWRDSNYYAEAKRSVIEFILAQTV